MAIEGSWRVYKLIEKTQEKYHEAEDSQESPQRAKGNKKNKEREQAATNIDNKGWGG